MVSHQLLLDIPSSSWNVTNHLFTITTAYLHDCAYIITFVSIRRRCVNLKNSTYTNLPSSSSFPLVNTILHETGTDTLRRNLPQSHQISCNPLRGDKLQQCRLRRPAHACSVAMSVIISNHCTIKQGIWCSPPGSTSQQTRYCSRHSGTSYQAQLGDNVANGGPADATTCAG